MRENSKATVFLVDDDEPVRRAIGLLLKSAGLACETFSSGDDFLASFDPSRPGCLLTDMRMPGISGLDLQGRLKDAGHDLPVIIITGHGDVPVAVRALKQGAVDFIEKPFSEQALLDAVNRALALDKGNRAEQARRVNFQEMFHSLSEREVEVMNLVVAGHPNKIIADDLGLSIKTVEFHRGNVMTKLQVESVVELVKLVISAQN